MYVLTWRAQVSRQLDCWGGGGGLFIESGKTNLETGKCNSLFSDVVSSLHDGATSLPSYVIGFVLRCRCPPWQRIYSALITDCGCMLINSVVPKDKNRRAFDVSVWQSPVVPSSLGDDP